MSGTFREFEKEAVRILCAGVLGDDIITAITRHSGTFDYEYTGSGYFLSIYEPWMPMDRAVMSNPKLVGSSGEIRSGFLAFLADREFTLECHTWGDIYVPEDFRDRAVRVSIEPTDVVDSH